MRRAHHIAALLLSLVLPAAAYASCLEERGSDFFGRPMFSTPVGARDRERIGSVIESQIDQIACAHFTPVSRLNVEASQIGALHGGYLVLTATSVMFISGQRGGIFARRKNEVLFDATYEELSEFSVLGKHSFPGVAIDMGNASMGASFVLPRGSYGEAIVAELCRRLIAACRTSIYETADEIRCQ